MNKVLAIGLMCIFLLGCTSVESRENVNQVVGQVVEIEAFSSFHFWQSIESAEEKGLGYKTQVAGGIAPHHLLADTYISHFYQTIENTGQSISRIVLFCPNHYHEGQSPVVTHNGSISSPIGDSNFDEVFIEQMISELDFVKLDNNNIIKNEHGITAHVPYIQHALPRVDIVPLVIDARIKNNQVNALADYLIENHTDETLYVCSMDFSHYLLQEETNKMDEESIQAIKKFDLLTISQFSDEHLDTPNGLIIFLKIMDYIGSHDVEVLGHSSANKIMKTNTKENTSYFTIMFSDTFNDLMQN